MSNVTRQILLESNTDLLREVKRLIALIEQVAPPPELNAYHNSVYQDCWRLRQDIESNLNEVRIKPGSVFDTLLSKTQGLNTELIFFNQHFIGPLRRYVPEDRLPLRILHWLYERHAVTRHIPIALTNSEFQVWPEIDRPTLYGLPVSMQKGLLYLPLLFHEFGHQLFACFSSELDKYIRDLQREIEIQLTPWSQGFDEHAARDQRRRKDIISTWYAWCEELFCDAVGLTIGGPAFLHALDRYTRISDRVEYHAPHPKLAHRGHPIFRLRIKLLVHQAKEFRCTAVANQVEENWASLAVVLRANEDYYGFYEEAYFPIIQKTLKKMVQEVGPYQFTDQDLRTDEWTPASTPVHLLNRAWSLYATVPSHYADWEQEIIDRFCRE